MRKQKNRQAMKDIVKPVQPSLRTSLILSFKSLKQNIFRFIFITLFFCISLVFATTTINLYYSNSNNQYAQYQLDYNNKYVSVSQKSTLYNQAIQSSLFQLESTNYTKEISNLSDQFKVYRSFDINFPIDEQMKDTLPVYLTNKVDHLIIVNDRNSLPKFQTIVNTEKRTIQCYITDMVADSLIACHYFADYECLGCKQTIDTPDQCPICGASADKIISHSEESYEKYFPNKTLKLPGCNIPMYIEGIIDTDYEEFIDKDLNDPNVYASYKDNLNYYNAIFMTKNNYVDANNENQFVSTNNIAYTYDDFIYRSFGTTQVIESIKCLSYTNDEEMVILKGHEPQKPLTDQSLQQIAVSKGFYEKYFTQLLEDAEFKADGITGDGSSYIDPDTQTQAVFSFYGFQRIITSFGCRVVGVVDEEEPAIYFCNPSECDDFYNYLKSSYSNYDDIYKELGGKLLISITDDASANTSLYQLLLDRKLNIDNLSFVKLQVVNEFIDNNLILFLGLFFALCLFSILMIFNFVVITIKNSTKDIGIYMSLGMNGFKIAWIYLFQILLVSFIAFVISIIGSTIFLKLLDYRLSETASTLIHTYYGVSLPPIDFDIFKLTTNGFIISLVIAFATPLITVSIPLINLSRKKPIDVIKLS